MKSSWKSLAWTGIYIILILSLLTNLSLITALLLIVPVIVLFNILDTKGFMIHVIPVWIVAFLIHPIYLLMALYFAVPAIFMGRCYKRRATALRTIVVGAATILVEMLLLLFIGTVLFQFDLSQYMQDIVNITMKPLQDMVASNGLSTDLLPSTEDMSLLVDMTIQRIPYALIVSSFLMAIISHVIVRPILSGMGYSVPKLIPAREWRFPRSLIWYYLIGVVIDMIAYNSDSGYLNMISANLVPILNVFFAIQAIGFFFYLAYIRKWHSIIPFLIAIPVLLFPPMAIIGILDIAFPLRQLMTKPKR
ncbi:DUF2232 domain-containing protein [Paenibacillus crassostreae]|uniref:DUF2232 domain-containing protein n=1 Tax=Paenibacillus crassostreae TaxID=1763538 RepID=A0A167BFL7_9BACL|nr:DUF2232 domain-containing protein [Paenibacillus crassostreae]AOZ92882.1 hypothetical protein LPB68_12105 [Paenibacillus crassostreae]OAB72028.1 hypothetical protein PNBC_18785 [Paenibacillus crassostreae]